MPMVQRTFLGVLARRWPVLAAWILGAEAAHYVFIHAAGWAGSHTALGGMLLLPLAVLARLVAYVAMYLVVRADLPAVRARTEPVHGIRDFAGAVSAAVLPFLVFYTAWGMLWADQQEYYGIAADIVARRELLSGNPDPFAGTINDVEFGVLPLTVLATALVLRTVLTMFADRLPRWTSVPAVYVETVWVTLLLTFVSSGVTTALGWLETRAGAVWAYGIGEEVARAVPLIGQVWDSVGGISGLLGDAILLPAAWIAIVGAIYGERMESTFDDAPSSRWTALLQMLGRRVEEIATALRLVWRSGPRALGWFLLAYAAWTLLDATATVVVPRLFGPQEAGFWLAFAGLIGVFIAAVFEPVRVVLIATAYDAFTVEGSAGEREPQGLATEFAGRNLDAQVGGNVVGDEEPDARAAGAVV